MDKPNQLKTFCLHLAVQIFTGQSDILTQQAQEIVEAAAVFENYLSTAVEEAEEVEQANEIEFAPDSNILSFADLNKPVNLNNNDNEDDDETPPETA